MSKSEFLKVLKEALSMSLDKNSIDAQIKYYDDYISDEMKNGKTEKEVLDELGDPRLIAKTIMTVNATEEVDRSDKINDNYANSSSSESYGRMYGERKTGPNNGGFRTYYNSNSVIGCTIAFLVLFIIAYGILRALGYLAYGVGSLAFSGPFGFILVMGLIYILFFSGRK